MSQTKRASPLSDEELAALPYGEAVIWCADEDGLLTRSRLARVARVKGYRPGWVAHNRDRHWRDVLKAAKQHRKSERRRLRESRPGFFKTRI